MGTPGPVGTRAARVRGREVPGAKRAGCEGLPASPVKGDEMCLIKIEKGKGKRIWHHSKVGGTGMKERGSRSRARKKKLCIVLMVSLLIGKASLLQGEAASPVQTGNGSDSGTELSEEEKESSATEDIEIGSQKSQESERVDETERIELETPKIENSEAETPEIDILESDVPETKESSSENVLGDTQGQDVLGQDASEAESVEAKVAESDILKSDSPESETSDFEEKTSDIEESKEIETNGSQAVLPDGEALGREEGLAYLQIPEKLEIVIDPWEIDERGQIYSEPFIVKNLGNGPGVLTLSFACRTNGEDGANISETKERLRESGEKLIYMRVAFENGEGVAFTKKGAQCKAELEPGEELALWFEGEVNEYAEEPWESEDIEIEGIYSWEREEIQSSETEAVLPIEPDEKDDSGEIPSAETNGVTSEEENIPAIESSEEDSSVKTSPVETDGEASEEENIPSTEPNEENNSEETFPAERDGEASEEENIPAIESNQEDGSEEVSPAEINGEASEEENIPPIEPNQEDGGEEVSSAEADVEASEEENIPSAEPDEKSSSEEVPFAESKGGIEESGLSENMSEE